MAKEVPYVVFGAWNEADKGLVTYRRGNMRCVRICQLKDGKDYGDTFDPKDIDGSYFDLNFCQKKSVEVFIKTLEEMLRNWK